MSANFAIKIFCRSLRGGLTGIRVQQANRWRAPPRPSDEGVDGPDHGLDVELAWTWRSVAGGVAPLVDLP
jgi:hypothetical protein